MTGCCDRYCLDPLSPCLVFPLMRGGSFADRLNPTGAKLEHLQRLGLPSPLKPLTWRQKLRTMAQVRRQIRPRVP